MTSSAVNPRVRVVRIAIGATALLAATLLVTAAYADRRLKMATHPGYLPSDLPLCVYSADMPRFWADLSRTRASRAVAKEAPYTLHEIELAIRVRTGIRPTPARLGTWLGQTICAGTDGANWVICTHPGLVAHTASLVFGRRFFERIGLHCAWRDGYLICASDSALLDRALTAPPLTVDLPAQAPSQSHAVIFQAPVSITGALIPSADLPFHLSVHASNPPVRDASNWTVPALSVTPAVSLSVRNGPTFLALVTLCAPAFNALPSLTGPIAPDRWNLPTPTSLFGPGQPLSGPATLAFCGLVHGADIPLPQLGLAVMSPTPLSSLLPTETNETVLFPYQWNGYSGWMFPLLGAPFSLYSFQRDDTQYLATQESLAAALSGPTPDTVPLTEDFSCTVSWKPLTEALVTTARWLAPYDLLPRTNLKDLDRRFFPLMNALASCGTCRVQGHWEEDHLVCDGTVSSDTPGGSAP